MPRGEDTSKHPNRQVSRGSIPGITGNKYSLSQSSDGSGDWVVDMVSDRGMAGHPHYTSQSWGTEEEANNWAKTNYGTDRLPNDHPRTI